MNQDLDNLQSQIVELVKPLKIILFGSRSKGTESESSDFDFLIVMPEGSNKRATAQFLYKRIDNIKVSYDFIVATPSTLDKYSKNPHLVYFHALKDGKVLYAV